MNTLKIGDLTLGEGMPKICIPLTGRTPKAIFEEAEYAMQQPCQLVEWRADFILSEMRGMSLQAVCKSLKIILEQLKNILTVPLLFTIRTQSEGGQISLSNTAYYYINQIVAETGLVDIIDIEAFDAPGHVEEEMMGAFIAFAKERGCHVLLSSHDFEQTPDMEEMLTRFFVMQELNADIVKLAVMPQNEEDVMNLLEVSTLMRDGYGKVPFIAISMGELGMTTRVCGGEFGSAITYAAGKDASAPGQLDAGLMEGLLQQYYGE